MICPACHMRVTPLPFTLWPGEVVNLCPKCRIGLGVLTDAKIKAASKKLAKARKPKITGD